MKAVFEKSVVYARTRKRVLGTRYLRAVGIGNLACTERREAIDPSKDPVLMDDLYFH